jgi:hypothetical protein
MNAIDEYEFWLGEFWENPQSPEDDKWRLLAQMCKRGNPHAIDHYERVQRAEKLAAIERGEMRDPDAPLNTIGDFDADEDDLSVVKPNLEADYPNNWPEISRAQKSYRNWQCEICSFRLVGSGLIQVHHIDRDKSNNDKFNLRVLCAVCHGDQHRSPPVWPPGALEADISKLISHHKSRRT